MLHINQSRSDYPLSSEESEELKADSSALLCSSFVHTFTGGGVTENVTVGLCCCSARNRQADSSSELHGELVSSVSLISLSSSSDSLLKSSVVNLCPVCAQLFMTPDRQVVTNSAADVFHNM